MIPESSDTWVGYELGNSHSFLYVKADRILALWYDVSKFLILYYVLCLHWRNDCTHCDVHVSILFIKPYLIYLHCWYCIPEIWRIGIPILLCKISIWSAKIHLTKSVTRQFEHNRVNHAGRLPDTMDLKHVSDLSNEKCSGICNDRKEVEVLSPRSMRVFKLPNVETEKRVLKKQTRHFKITVMLVESLLLSHTIMHKAVKLQEQSRIVLADVNDRNSTDAL